jgi:hypothetical protein
MPVNVPGGDIVANPAGVIVHVPPAGPEEIVVVFPTHVTKSPVSGAGSGLMVTVLSTEQPVTGIVYVTEATPGATGVMTPVDAPMV